jgi:hypothetical protein
MSTSTFHLGIFYMPQIYDMGPMALLPLRRKACWGFFRPEKSWWLRPGLNPRTWVLKGSTLPLDHQSRLPICYSARCSARTCNTPAGESLILQQLLFVCVYLCHMSASWHITGRGTWPFTYKMHGFLSLLSMHGTCPGNSPLLFITS